MAEEDLDFVYDCDSDGSITSYYYEDYREQAEDDGDWQDYSRRREREAVRGRSRERRPSTQGRTQGTPLHGRQEQPVPRNARGECGEREQRFSQRERSRREDITDRVNNRSSQSENSQTILSQSETSQNTFDQRHSNHGNITQAVITATAIQRIYELVELRTVHYNDNNNSTRPIPSTQTHTQNHPHTHPQTHPQNHPHEQLSHSHQDRHSTTRSTEMIESRTYYQSQDNRLNTRYPHSTESRVSESRTQSQSAESIEHRRFYCDAPNNNLRPVNNTRQSTDNIHPRNLSNTIPTREHSRHYQYNRIEQPSTFRTQNLERHRLEQNNENTQPRSHPIREHYRRGPTSTQSIPPERRTTETPREENYLQGAKNIQVKVNTNAKIDSNPWFKNQPRTDTRTRTPLLRTPNYNRFTYTPEEKHTRTITIGSKPGALTNSHRVTPTDTPGKNQHTKGKIQFQERVDRRKQKLVQNAEKKRQKKWHSSDKHPEGKMVKRNKLNSKTAITGHSFARRLVTVLEERANQGTPWEETLQLHDSRIHIVAKGFGGAYVRHFHRIREYVEDEEPDAIILELGSNDLTENVDIEDLSNTLIMRCKHLLRNHRWIQALIWCQVTPRTQLENSPLALEDYNTLVAQFNQLMREKIRHVNKLHHWHHQGLTQPDPLLTPDGIHPTTSDGGTNKYLRSIGELCRWTRANQCQDSETSDSTSTEEETGAD